MKLEDQIKQQEERVRKLRIKYNEAASKAYKAFIAVTGKIERERLDSLKRKLEVEKSAAENFLKIESR